jgi:hypothetical protein
MVESNSGFPSDGDEIVREHLGYALDLVALSLREIAEPPHDDPDREWYRRMSIIEVFWSQARILVEFFTGVLASTTTSAAEHFTSQPVQYVFPNAQRLKEMRNDQIAHMNYARTTDKEQKLQPADIYLTAAAIDRAAKLFVKNLKPEYQSVWDARVSGHRKIEAEMVYASNSPQACTAAPQVLHTTSCAAGGQRFKVIGRDGPKGPDGPTGTPGPFGPTGPLGPRS